MHRARNLLHAVYGDVVKVFGFSLSKTLKVEGSATIKKLLPSEDCYLVEFEDEPGANYERFVDPNQDQV